MAQIESIPPERLHGCLILVVDDVEMNLKLLSHSLHSKGYRNIITATDGQAALAATHHHRPDLVILDLMMPTMDGFAYCEAIRADPQFDAMPILVQTAIDDMDKKIQAFELGATDYICKPIDGGELCARTQVHLTQRLLIGDLHTTQARMQQEMQCARQMQNRLMPGKAYTAMCERLFDVDIASHFETSSELGGDYRGMRMISDKRLAVYQFDFSGHGMGAAMNVFRMHTLMQECMHAGGDPGNFLTTLNDHLYPLLERDEFATMFYGVIDVDANCLLYAAAAMHPALILSNGESQASELAESSFPLGALQGSGYTTTFTPFTHGDALLLFSDCLIETPDASGQMLTPYDVGHAAALGAVRWQDYSAQNMVDTLVERLAAHSPEPLVDDLTISVYARN